MREIDFKITECSFNCASCGKFIILKIPEGITEGDFCPQKPLCEKCEKAKTEPVIYAPEHFYGSDSFDVRNCYGFTDYENPKFKIKPKVLKSIKK